MVVSIIIPTYNRPLDLLRAMRSLQEQSLANFEIIVVDNAADSTVKQMVTDFNRTARVPICYIPEPYLGLHHARHAGARVAEGDILVFTDDDATFDEGWLQAYSDRFEANPDMSAAGGPVRPVWEAPPPRWLLKYIEECSNSSKMFSILSLMDPYQEFRLDADGFFFGVNMAIRRDVLFEVGGFNPELIGTLTVGDGESGLHRKLQQRDLLIGYVPDALVYHHIPPQRLTMDYLCQWQAHLAGTQLYARYHRHMPSPLGLAADGLKTALKIAPIWMFARFIRSRTNRFTISLQLRAALGYAQLRYIFHLIYDGGFRQMVTHQDWLNSPPAATKTE